LKHRRWTTAGGRMKLDYFRNYPAFHSLQPPTRAINYVLNGLQDQIPRLGARQGWSCCVHYGQMNSKGWWHGWWRLR
jgi:hypothetical protein